MTISFSTFQVMWPDPEPPSEEAVNLALVAEGLEPVEHHVPLPYEGARVSFAREQGLCVGCVPVERPPEYMDPDVLRWPDSILQRLRDARWCLEVRMAVEGDPIVCLQRQMRLLLAVRDDAAGYYDADAQWMRSRREVRDLAAATVPPPVASFYRIQAITPDRSGGGVWMHTHGLQRLGFPDVEILDVPPPLMHAGAGLVHAFVTAYFGDRLPAMGKPCEFVVGSSVAMRALPGVLERLPAHVGGGRRDRPSGGGHRGRRVVLVRCDGGRPHRWRPPVDALRRLDDGDVLVGVAPGEAERQEARARESWSRFGLLFADHRDDPSWHFAVCLDLEALEGPDGPIGRSPLWFEVLDVQPGRVRGRPIGTPPATAQFTPSADEWYDLGALWDWRASSPTRTHRPEGSRRHHVPDDGCPLCIAEGEGRITRPDA